MKKRGIPGNRFLNFYHFEETSSTMDECEDLIRSGVCSGIVLADSQTAGRGRNAKKWISEANGNIYLSFFDVLDEASPINLIPQRCAAAAYSVVSHFVKNAGEVRIKWPNDIFIGMKKVSGIIAKTMLFEGKRFYVCGIGINVFMPEGNPADFVWPPAALSDSAVVTTEKVLECAVAAIDRAFSCETREIIDVYGRNINWMTGREIVFSQDLVKRETGRIAGFSEDFSVIKILTAQGLQELSALSVLSLA